MSGVTHGPDRAMYHMRNPHRFLGLGRPNQQINLIVSYARHVRSIHVCHVYVGCNDPFIVRLLIQHRLCSQHVAVHLWRRQRQMVPHMPCMPWLATMHCPRSCTACSTYMYTKRDYGFLSCTDDDLFAWRGDEQYSMWLWIPTMCLVSIVQVFFICA